MPNKNEGSRSIKSRSLGLNEKKVANLKKVKMSRKIVSKLITHMTVFGIFNFTNIKSPQKKEIPGYQQ